MIFLYKITEPEHIRATIEDKSGFDGYIEEYAVSADEVADGIARMKENKNDGCAGLSTNHFKFACFELFTHVSYLC